MLELIAAARQNNLSEVLRLLRAGADANAKDGGDRTALYHASHFGYVQVVQVLLEHGADIDAENRYGETPLHEACFNGQLLVVKSLLSGGADIFAVNGRGEHPMHYAVSAGNAAVAKCLLQHLYATTCRFPLHELLKDLTWIGDPVSSDAPRLYKALLWGVLDTDDVVEIIEYLVSRNPALLSSRDQDDSLPLHVACRRGASFAIVQSLVNVYKASVKSVTSQGDLPLFLACEMSETSLNTIFLLMKLYPDLVYR
jgi:ankyrin repeat protein